MATPNSRSWLDTETKAELYKHPPERLAPPITDSFAVVVLAQGTPTSFVRQVRAFDKVLGTSRTDAEDQTKRTPPFVLKRSLSLSDALLAQFELVCCDIVAIFLSENVVSNADAEYLASVYRNVRNSDEFQLVSVRVEYIPVNANGQAFADQFVGAELLPPPVVMSMMRKKARIMLHWSRKIGAHVFVPVGSNE